MNNIVLIGRLTSDPELKYLQNGGKAVTNFTLAVDKDLSKDKKQEFESQGKPTADFLRIVVFGGQAESCANYLAKGRLTGVQGRIQTRNYENSEGQKVYITEVVANRVQFLEWKDNDNGFVPTDEDIPF